MKGLPVKTDVLKASKLSAPVMDDSEETKRKLETLDLPDVDMSMTDGQENVGNLEGDDDDDMPDDEGEEVERSVPACCCPGCPPNSTGRLCRDVDDFGVGSAECDGSYCVRDMSVSQ